MSMRTIRIQVNRRGGADYVGGVRVTQVHTRNVGGRGWPFRSSDLARVYDTCHGKPADTYL